MPREYQQVEYLQSDGNQFIDSGVKIASTLETHIKGLMTVRKNYGMMAGGRNNSSTDGRYIVLSVAEGNNLRAVYGNYSSNLNISAYNMHECVYNDSAHKMYIDGSAVANFGTAQFTNSSAKNLYIFSGSGYDTSTAYSLGCKICYCKLYNNTSADLLRDFVPCYRKSDNVAGMYDFVSQTFFINSGTGTFVVGPNV